MKVKLSSYVSQFLVDHGITHAFTVTGGGAMHLMIVWDIRKD